MNVLDEYDVRDAFAALDAADVRQSISLDDFGTLYLGLGFVPRLTPEQLHREVNDKLGVSSSDSERRLTLPQVLHVLSEHTRDRQASLRIAFDSIDQGRKGFLTETDLEEACRQVARSPRDPSPELMLKHLQQQKQGRVDARAFCHYFAPPEP